jgi:hypothetical protein
MEVPPLINIPRKWPPNNSCFESNQTHSHKHWFYREKKKKQKSMELMSDGMG